MLMPDIFRENLLDDFFGYPFLENRYESGKNQMMKTDVKDTENGYEMIMNLPGVKKENVQAELKNGYLTIHASSSSENEEKDEAGRYIRRERYSGACSRSFYVGNDVKQEEIRARFEDGTLKLLIPKKEERPAVEKNHYIAIEG